MAIDIYTRGEAMRPDAEPPSGESFRQVNNKGRSFGGLLASIECASAAIVARPPECFPVSVLCQDCRRDRVWVKPESGRGLMKELTRGHARQRRQRIRPPALCLKRVR